MEVWLQAYVGIGLIWGVSYVTYITRAVRRDFQKGLDLMRSSSHPGLVVQSIILRNTSPMNWRKAIRRVVFETVFWPIRVAIEILKMVSDYQDPMAWSTYDSSDSYGTHLVEQTDQATPDTGISQRLTSTVTDVNYGVRLAQLLDFFPSEDIAYVLGEFGNLKSGPKHERLARLAALGEAMYRRGDTPSSLLRSFRTEDLERVCDLLEMETGEHALMAVRLSLLIVPVRQF